MPIRIIRTNNLKSKYDAIIVPHILPFEITEHSQTEDAILSKVISVTILEKELSCKHLFSDKENLQQDYLQFCINCIQEANFQNDAKICIILPDTLSDWMSFVDCIAKLEETDDVLVHIWVTSASISNKIPHKEDLERYIQQHLDNGQRQNIKNAIVDFLVKATSKGVLPTAPLQKASYEDDGGTETDEKADLLSQLPKNASPELMKYMEEKIDESFWSALTRMRKEKGMTNVQCYNRANVTKQLYSKIKNNAYYTPRKNTALAFAVSLRLNLEETDKLLEKAGLTLSDSEIFDLIVKYHIEKEIYNIHVINEVLFAFDQSLLGGQ